MKVRKRVSNSRRVAPRAPSTNPTADCGTSIVVRSAVGGLGVSG
jgi:hypothetical protein